MKVLFGLFAAYAVLLAMACVMTVRVFSIHPAEHHEVLASVWERGVLVERAVFTDEKKESLWVERARGTPGRQVVLEIVEGDGPIFRGPEALFSVSLVAPLEGVRASLGGETAYVTPDDLLSRQAYDHGIFTESLGLSLGTDAEVVLFLLAERLHTRAGTVRDFAKLERIRVRRAVIGEEPSSAPMAATLTRDIVGEAATEAAHFLARGVNEEGRFRYAVDAPTNRTLPGYDWPRHAGATYFLAQAAALTRDDDLRSATIRAASRLRDRALVRCGDHACISADDTDGTAEIGSSALAIIAFVEMARTGHNRDLLGK